jgi:hypothetical protein
MNIMKPIEQSESNYETGNARQQFAFQQSA